jgi:hypothetical protein
VANLHIEDVKERNQRVIVFLSDISEHSKGEHKDGCVGDNMTYVPVCSETTNLFTKGQQNDRKMQYRNRRCCKKLFFSESDNREEESRRG